MRKLFFLAVLSFASVARAGVSIKIPLTVDLHRYEALLTHPGYLAVALENIGVVLHPDDQLIFGKAGSLMLVRPSAVPFSGIVATVVGEGAESIQYVVEVRDLWQLMRANLTLSLRINRKALENGVLDLSVEIPAASLLPGAVVRKAEAKALALFSPETQKALADYLKKLENERGRSGLAQGIAEDAQNRKSRGRKPASTMVEGEEPTLWDLRFFFLSVALWTVGLVVFGSRYRLKLRNKRR